MGIRLKKVARKGQGSKRLNLEKLRTEGVRSKIADAAEEKLAATYKDNISIDQRWNRLKDCMMQSSIATLDIRKLRPRKNGYGGNARADERKEKMEETEEDRTRENNVQEIK